LARPCFHACRLSTRKPSPFGAAGESFVELLSPQLSLRLC
jgi:hypothetical protein